MKINTEQKVHYTLRIACALCFIGHGAFGIITKAIWCNYFGVFGIGEVLSYQLMPFVGSIDILCGILILVYPVRAVVLWLVVWGFITAMLRPLSGEPFAEFIERFGNFGTPFVLLILCGGFRRSFKRPLSSLEINFRIDEQTWTNVIVVLRFVVFFLICGHGVLNLLEKKSLLDQYVSLGFIYPAETAQIVGLFEITMGLFVLIRPLRPVVFGLFLWKITSELFYPQHELFEWIERAGSYGAILGLWFALEARSNFSWDKFSFNLFPKALKFSKNHSLND
jgi:uncharacterized membrane protein YphA (DoxX/SURF4 family)